MKYQLIRVYNDFTSATESNDSITTLLNVAAIYLEDTDCVIIKIIDRINNKIVLDFMRE